MKGPGRADIGSGESGVSGSIVNAGSGESGYRVNAGGESGYSAMQGPGRADIVNAGSGESGYSECRVRGERI
ncbi:unnamed protein product [Staurois parvus]|uniref:Uncharacterized protein n=1 Tax=Staurois parvus TaxID=386267 RepID=A0ABN9AJT6_9NEOB|nr:unnamed protein product [Staurois parvus]